MWTSHTYKSCAKAGTILVFGEWRTEVKPQRRSNPKGWVVADHIDVILNPEKHLINQFHKTHKLLYNKEEVSFNIQYGKYLLFDEEGCTLLHMK